MVGGAAVYLVNVTATVLQVCMEGQEVEDFNVAANVFSTRMRMRDMTALKVRLWFERKPLRVLNTCA